jgi:hypothetical protein
MPVPWLAVDRESHGRESNVGTLCVGHGTALVAFNLTKRTLPTFRFCSGLYCFSNLDCVVAISLQPGGTGDLIDAVFASHRWDVVADPIWQWRE